MLLLWTIWVNKLVENLNIGVVRYYSQFTFMVATFEPKELQRIVNNLFLYGKNVFSARL